jgi:hypothetical protein
MGSVSCNIYHVVKTNKTIVDPYDASSLSVGYGVSVTWYDGDGCNLCVPSCGARLTINNKYGWIRILLIASIRRPILCVKAIFSIKLRFPAPQKEKTRMELRRERLRKKGKSRGRTHKEFIRLSKLEESGDKYPKEQKKPTDQRDGENLL